MAVLYTIIGSIQCVCVQSLYSAEFCPYVLNIAHLPPPHLHVRRYGVDIHVEPWFGSIQVAQNAAAAPSSHRRSALMM